VFESYFPGTSFPNDAGIVGFSIEATCRTLTTFSW
jgi:hypothetical protein